MNQFRFLGKNCRKISLSSLLLTLVSCFTVFPVQAQFQVNKLEIAQALTDSQTQNIKKQAEEFIELLGKKKASQARKLLTPALQADWTAEKIQALWDTDLISKLGPYQKVLRSKVIDIVNADIVKVTVQFAKGTEDILVTFNKQQKLIATNWTSGKNIEEISTAFVTALAMKDYARARDKLSPLIKTELFPATVQQNWETLLKRTGPFQKILNIQNQPGGTTAAANVVIVKIQFEKVTDQLFIFFNSDKQIVNVDFPE